MKKKSHEGIYEDPRVNQQEQKLDFNKSEVKRTNGSFMDGRLLISEKYVHSPTQTHTHKHIIKKKYPCSNLNITNNLNFFTKHLVAHMFIP